MTNLFGFNVDSAIAAMGDAMGGAMGAIGSRFASLGGGGGNPFGAASPQSGNPFGMSSVGGGNPFGASGISSGNPFGSTSIAGGNPFGSSSVAAGNPFGSVSPQAGNPFGSSGIAGGNPFGSSGIASGGNPFGSSGIGGGNPFGGSAGIPAKDTSTLPNHGSTSGAGGTPSSGMPPGVAKWAQKTKDTFSDIQGLDPDTMLAIMMNESGGDENVQNHMGQPAYGLFQLWQQPGLNADQQFAAAHSLALDKMAGINNTYAKLGLNPDARTRARDFALAWAGQFDYATGQPATDRPDAGSGQLGPELAQVFLKNYDAIKAGRSQSTNIGGGTGGLQGLTPGTPGSVMQEFGDTDYSDAHPSTYGYAEAYGAHGHTGVDWAVPRGTKVAAPVSGTITLAGGNDGSGYFYSDNTSGVDADHKGELRIQLANGDILILGHMGDLTNVHVGQVVNPGDFVGLSGGSDGDHIHVEYRQKDPSMPSGYRIIDPRTVLR